MCSSTTCGRSPSSVVPQPAHHHRVVDRGQRRDLAAQAAQAGLVVDLGGPEHLDHDGGVGDLVEGEVGLVRRPAAEQPHRGQLGGDRRHPRRSPSCLLGHGRSLRCGRDAVTRVSLRERSLVCVGRPVALPVAAVPGPVAGLVAAAPVAVAADPVKRLLVLSLRRAAVAGVALALRVRARRWCRRHRRRRPATSSGVSSSRLETSSLAWVVPAVCRESRPTATSPIMAIRAVETIFFMVCPLVVLRGCS